MLPASRRMPRQKTPRPIARFPAGSGRLAGAIHRLERDRPRRMPLSEAFQAWERLVRNGHPWTDPLHPWQDGRENLDARADLEFALHALPRRAARELRSLVNPLDEIYLSNTSPDPYAPPDQPWWQRRYLE